MSFWVRPARLDDLDAIYRMAQGAGGGLTNLPPVRDALADKLARSNAALERTEDTAADDRFVFALVDGEGGVHGTSQIFTRVGLGHPFYSYRLGVMSQVSRELGSTFRAEMLTLSTDLDGSSEVGGLYLEPGARSGGCGALLARSRYLFIRRHRARFADRTVAELRGVIDDTGSSPFWDGLAGRFFGMSFREADEFNAINGNQFIADLMPKHPIYTALLVDTAREVIGVPHISGRPAMRMLEAEGFRFENYLDIFDGGPTMCIATDRIASISSAREAVVIAIGLDGGDGEPSLIATGHLAEFRAGWGQVVHRDDGVIIDAQTAQMLSLRIGDTIDYVGKR
ncbi:MAG: arginine N-succinyltransferase [Pseudomonadota bacterium]|nr:arginine N-succinyltransferase [Pseudomonadota bacterium]